MSLFRGDIEALMGILQRIRGILPFPVWHWFGLRGRSDPRAGAAAEVCAGVVRSSFLCPCCVGVAIGFTKLSRAFSYGLKDDFCMLR